MSGKKSRKVRIGSSRQRRRNEDEHEANKDDDGSEMSSKERKVVEVGTDSVSVILQTDLVSPANLSSITQQYTERNNPPLHELTESHLSQPVNPCLLKSPDTAGKRRKMRSTRQNKSKQEQTEFGEKEDTKTGDTKQFIELQASIAVVESGSQSNTEELLGPKESEMDTECRRHSDFHLIASNTFDQLEDRCKEEVGEGTELSREAAVNYSSELQSTPSDSSLGHDKSAQSESRRRKMGSTRRNPRDRHEEEEDGASKMHRYRYLYDEGEEGDGTGNEKNKGEERNEESVLTGLSCSFSSSSQEGRNIEADNIESESQSIIKESMAAKLILLRESELTELSQTLHNPYPDVPTIESYDSYLTDDTLNSNPAITGLQHKETLIEETLDKSRENTDSPPDPPSLQSSLGPEETAKVESYTPGKKRKIGSTRSKTHRDRKGGERRKEGKEEEKGEDTEGIGEGGDVMIAVEMESSSIEKTELVELEEHLEKVTKEQAMGDPETIVMEGEVNIVAEEESGIEKSELVKHTEKVREAEEIEVEVKIVTESESRQTPSGTAALTVEAQESGDMVCIEPHISSQYMEDNDPSLNDLTESKLSQTGNSTRRNKGKQEETDFVVKEDAKTGDTEQSLELQASIAVVESGSHSNTKELLGPKEIEMDTECRSQSEVLLFSSNTLHQPDDTCKEEVCEDTEPSSEAEVSYSSEFLQDALGTESLSHLPLDLALQVVQGFAAEPITGELKKEGERRQESESEHAEAESSIFHSSRHSLDQSLESDTLTNTEEFESFNNTIILQSGEGEEKLEPVVNESELQDDINSTGPGNQETLHQRDEAEDVVDLIVEENIVLAYRPHFRQPDHVESYQPEQSEDITCFLQSTPSDSSLGHDKSAQSESQRRKMDSTSRNPRGRHEEEEDGESKMHRYHYLYDEGEEVILGKEEMFGIKETEFEMSIEPKGSASGDEKEGEQMETEEDTENIQETGERLELDMGTVEGSGVETLEESLMLLEQEHRADEEKKGMDEESLIEPTPFDQDIDSFGIADQLHNQEKGNQVTVETVNTETESNNEASMAHIVDPIERFSVGLDQSGDTLLSEEEVSDFTLLVNESEVSKSSQITCDRALKIESDGILSTDPKISPSQLIQTPCMEISNPFLNPLLLQSIQGNEEDANTDSNTTVGLDTSEVILLREEEVSDHVLLVNEVSVSSQMTYDDRTLTTEPCQTDEALITDPSISGSKLNQTPYSDESHNSFLNPLLLQSVQDQGVNAANRDSNQSPSPSRRRKMGSIRRNPPGAQKEELGKEEKQEGEIESIEDLEDKGEDMEAVEGSYIEFEMLMESKDGTGNEKNEGEERNEESVLTGLSCSFSSSSQEGRNIEADNIESESQSIIKESMAAKLILLRESELTELSQTLHNPYPDVPTIESYDSYLTDDTLNSNPAITGLQHKETLIEETLDESRENTDSPPDPPSLQSSLGPEETAKVESYTTGKKRKIGSTRSKTHRDRKGEERREEGKEEEKGEDTEGIGEGGDVMIAVEMESSSIEKTELVELEELTKEQAMGDPETIVMEGEVNKVAEGESGIEKSELVKHTEKVREAEEIEVEVKIVTESESSQTPSGTAALTVEAQESGDMVCIEPHISSQYMEDNDPSLNDLTESKLSQTGNSTRRNKGKQEETDFVVKEDAKTGDTEQSLELQASIAVVESGSHSNTKELLGPKEIEMDTECRSQSEVLLFSSNTLHQPDDTCKEEVCEDTEPSSEAVVSYSSEFLQDALGTESLSHLPLDLALQVVQGFAAEPITGELKKEGERRQESESEHAEAESSIFHSSRHSLDQSLESDTLTNTEEFESFNNTIILQSGEGEEKLEPVVNESELQDDINSTGPGNQETLHQRDEAEDVVDLIVEENIVLAYRPHFRQPDHVESYQPEQSEDITCFLQSTPSDSSLGHDKSAQSESQRRKMDSTSRNPRGRHEEEEDGESKMHRYRYLYDEGEEVILGKEEMFGIKETEFEMSMEPKGSASGDEKEGEQMETEEDTENIQETGERLELDMGTVEGSGVETLEESLMLLEQEHRADEEKKGMDEESLIEPTPFDQDIDSFGIADQLHNQEKGNQVTVETVNTETESNNEASMAHIVDPIERFSVGLDQSGDTLLSEEEVSDFTLLVNESEVSKSSQITCDRALKIESDGTLSTDPKISPSQLIQTPCMEITIPFLNPLLLQSIQGNEEDANTDSNTTVGLDTSEVILLREEEVSDHVLLVNEVSVSSQMTYDDRTLTTEPCQTDEALITDPSISGSKLNQTPYSDESHNSFLNPLLLQSVQDQGVNAANRDSNQSPSPSRRRKMGSIRRHPPGAQKEELGKEEKQEGEIESIEDLEDKGEDMEAVEGSYIEFEMLMESKDGTGNEKNEGEERNEESVLTGLSCSFSSSSQEGRNIEADNIESESQSIIKESMAAKLILLRESELTELSQTLHNPYPDVPTIESYDSYLTDDTLNSNPAITGLQHKETLIEETLDESRENTDSPPDPPSLQSSLGPEETAKVESYTTGKKRKIGSTRSKTHRDRKGEERREEGKEEEKGEDTEGIGEGGDVMIAVEMESSSIEKTELVELEELTKEQAMGDPETIVMEGEVNKVAEGESGIEKSELVKHTEKVREAEEIEVEVKIVTESESSQTPSGTAALTVEAQESGDMVCIEPHISSQYMEDNDPSLNDLTESKLSQTGNSTRRNKGKQEETDFVVKEDAKTGDTEQSLELQASIAVVESGSHSNTKELLGPKEIEMDTECRSQSEVLLFSSNTLHQPDDTCKEEVCEDTEPSSEAVVSYSSEFLQDALGTESLSHLPLDLALQVVQGFAAEPITGELKKEGERRQESESEHAEAESSIFHSSRHSLDQSLESDTLTNTEEFESFNNTIILQSGEGEEKLEPVVNESELQDDINSTGPGNQETLHQRDEAEDVVDLIVEENIVLAYRPHFRQPDHVESYQPEQSEDITCFLQSTPSDSSLGHDKSAQSESQRRKMDSTSRNPRGRHEEEEDGESKMHRYRYLYDEGEEVILGKEEMFGIKETEFEMSMEPKGSASGDETEGEQMETEEDTENIQETGERLELDMGTVEGSGVETLEESLMLLEQEHRADEENKGMDEESLIEPTPFDQDIDSFGIADQLHNQEKGNQVTVETVNTETESNNEASMAHIVDPIERFSVGLDQSGDTLLSEEEVSDFTLLVNESEVSKSSQITCDRALKIESDGTLSTDPKISPSQLIQTPCMEITIPFLNPLLLQSIQGNEEDANTDSNTTVGLDTSEVILLREEEVSDHVLLVNEVSVSSQMTYDDRTLTTEPCQTDEALITDPSISGSKLNQTPYSDESHNSFLNPLLLQSVQDQGVNAANRDSNQSPSPSRRRKMGSIRRHPPGAQKEELGKEEKQEGEIESIEDLEDKGEDMEAVEGSYIEFEMLMESKDGTGNEKNEGEERNEESVLTGLSCSFSSSSQEGRNIEADNIESESQSIIKESMAAKLILLRESELTELSQTLHNPYPDVPTIESYDSYLTDDTLNSNPAITGLQHKETLIEETLDESRENTDSPPDPPSLQSSLGPEETAKVESYTTGKKRKIGSTRSKTHRDRKGEERREEGKEEEKGEDTEGIGEGGDVMIAVEMESSSIEKTELVELEELTKEQAMGDPETIVMEGEVNKVAEGESGIEKSELVKHTEKVREAEEIEVEVKIVTESESSQTPSGTAALTVEAQESGDMVCIEPHISSQYMEDNDPSLNDLTESKLSQTGNSTRRNKGKQEETDFVVKEDAKTGDTEQSLELQASIAVVESGSHSNTKELLGPKEIEMDTECRSQSEVLLFSSNTLHQPDDTCKEEVCEDTEPSSEAVVSYSSEFLQDALGTESLSHLPLDLALQVVQGFAAEPITGELKKEGERRQESESEHAEAESSIFHSSRHSLDQSLESDTLTNTEEFESFNNTIILQSGEGEEKLEPVVNESELQDDINSTGPGNQETLHQRDEAEDVVDLIVEENIVLAYRPHFRQPDHVESYQPEQSEDITCFLQSTPSDSSLGHDKSAQSESQRRKMDSTSRNPRGRHEEEEDGESKMHRYRYLYDEGEEVILGKEEMFGIKETEFEMSMEPKGSASGDEKEGEQMETEEDTENIQETGERLELDMGTVEGSGVETLEESLMLLEQEHRADEEKKGMDEESLIEITPFDQDIDSFGIADQLHNQEKGNQVTVETVNTETESNNEASMAQIVDPIERFSVGLDQSGDTLLSEEEVSDFTLLVNESEVSKSSQITCDRALKIESDGTLSTDPKISPSQLIQTPCMEITIPFLNPLLLQSIQGNEEDANTDSNTTVGLDTSEVILLREEEVSDHVLLVNEVSVSSQMTYDDRTLTTEPCQTDEALITDPSISGSKLNQTPYSDESHNSFLNPLLLQSVQDQGVNAANRDSNQSPSPSRRRKMGSIRRHPPGAQKEELGKEEKQEGEIESIEDLEDKGEDMEAVEGSYIEFEMLMESKDGTGNEKNEGEERNEESVLTGLSCSFSSSSQEGRNIEADNIESESQSIIKESMAAKLILLRESELTELSQTLHNPYPDVPTIESYDSYLTDDTLNSNPAITGLQHKETLIEETLDESRENTDSPPDPPSLQSSLGPEETAKVESYTTGKKRKIGSTRSKTHRDRKGEERREEGKEEEKGEDTEGIGEGGDVMIAVEMESSSIEKTELVELEELTKEQAMGDPETIVMEGEVNKVAEGESGIEKSELVKHTEKVREAEEIEVEVKIVTESESSQTPSGTAALTVEAQESGDMVCIEPHISSQYMEDNDPSLNDLTESKLSQTGNSTRRNKGKQEETDFVVKEDAKTGDTEQSLELQASIAVVESGSHSNTKELLGPKEIEMDTECRSQSEVLLFSSNTLHQPDDTCKEEVCEDTEPSSEAVVSYSSEFLQDALGTESLSHLPLDLALQVVQGFAAEPITGELKKEGERRQESESEHAEAESSIFHSSRHSLDQSLESDTLTNTEEFESFNNTIILQSGEGEEKLEPVVNESELQDDINSTGPGNQETLHQRDEAEDVVDLIVEENIVLAYRPHFRQPDHVESYQPEQSEDITCFLQSTPSDSSLGHDKSAQSESQRRKMDSTSRNPRGRHEEEEDGESKMHRYRYLYDEGEEVILGKEEMFGIKETEFEMSMEPKGSASGDEKEGEQMETEEDTENIQETGERLELDMGTVEGSGVETLEESLMLLEQEHRADEEKKGMDEESLIEPTPFDQDIDSFGIADQLHNQEKGNQVTVETVNTETESNNEASMAQIVDPIERFSVGLDQSGDTLLSEEEVSDFTLLVNESEVSKSSQITCDRALKIESDGTLSTDPKISPSQLIQTPCMEITIPFLNPLLLQSIQGNEEDANTDSNTTVGLDTSEVILLREEEVSDHVLLVNEVSVSSQMTYDDRTLTTEPCQTDEALITDPSISGSKLNQTPYSDESHNSFLNPLLLQSVQDQGVNAANRDSNQSPSPSRRRKMGSIRRHPPGAQKEELGKEEKQEGEIESIEDLEDKGEDMEAVEGSYIEFEMLMESKDGTGNEKNEGEERNEESVLTGLSCSFSSSSQEGRNIEADNIESESQSIIKESMAAKLILLRESELTELSQTLHNPYPDVPTIESYDSYLTDDTLNSNPAITGLQHKETLIEETLDESRENTDSPPDPPSLQSSLGPEETAKVESYTTGKKRKIGSTRSKTHRDRKGEERREEGKEEEKGEDTEGIGEGGDVMIAVEMESSSIEKTELVELEELTKEQAMGDPETIVMEGEVNKVAEGESGIEKSELVKHTEKVREAEEIEVEVKIVTESESSQTPSGTAALTVEAQESGDMVCIEPHISSQYMEDNDPSLNDLTESKLSQTGNSTRRNKGKQEETDFVVKEDAKTGDTEQSLELQASIAVVESGSHSNTKELLGPKEIEMDTECRSQSEVLLFSSNTLHQPDDTCKEEVCEDTEPSSEAVVSYSSEFLQDALGTESLSHLPLDLALQVVQGFAAEPIIGELKKEGERRQESESEHAEAEPSIFHSSRHSLDQSLESDTLTNTEEFESFNNTIILQSGEGEEKLEPVVNESELQDDINSTGPGNQETLHQRDEAEDIVDLIVEENIVLAYRPHFRQPDHVESYQPEQSEDITCFLQSTPSDSSLGHDKSAQSESRRRKMDSTSRNPRGRHEEEEDGESKMHRYRYLYDEGEEVILGKEEMFGIKETEFEMSMEPKGSASGDEKEGEQMETEEDTENIQETGERLELDMGTVEGSGVETLEESLMLLEQEHRADEEKKGMDEESLIEPTPFDQDIDSFGIADQLHNQEKGNQVTVETVNTETESNNEASMAHIVDPIERFSVGLDQSGDTLLSEEEVSDFTLLVNESEVSKSSQITCDRALKIESDGTLSTDPKISPSQLIQTPCMEISNPFLNPLLLQSIQGNEEDANTDSNTTVGLDTSEVILLREEEVSDHVLLVNEVSVSSQITYDDRTLTTEPCQTDEALITDPSISGSKLNQTPYSDESHNSFLNPLLLQSVQDQGVNAANRDSNQSPSPSRRRKMGSIRRHPPGAQKEELGKEEKQEGEIESIEDLEDKGEDMEAVEGSYIEFEMLMESKDGTGNEKNEGEERNEESVLTGLSCSFSSSSQEGRNIEADNIESESQSIIKESMAAKLILLRESELTELSQTLNNPYPDVPTIESYDSYLTDDTLNSNPAITGLQHKETLIEETLDESRENTDSPPDPPSLQSSLGPEETAKVESYTPGKKRKIGSTRSKTHRDRKGGERREERKEEEKGEDTEGIGEGGDVMIAVVMESSSIEKTELVELEELLEKVTKEQAMGDPETIVMEGEVNIVAEEESGIEKSELVKHTEKVREAEEIEVEVKIVTESESSQTPSGTAALTVEFQESGGRVCLNPHISAIQLTQTAYMEQRLLTPSNSPNPPSKSSLSLSSQSQEDVSESIATGKRITMGSTHLTRGGLHTEEETQETGENVTEAEVRAEAFVNPEVNAVLERFQEEIRGEAVSLEDQQETQSLEKETILIEVVASSTALSGRGSEQVAPAPQPVPGNQRGEETAERVEKGPVTREKNKQSLGTFGSSGSKSNPYNVVMVGNSSVGKTSFMRRFQSGEFCLHHNATIGIDTCIQPVTVDASPVTLQLWDTAGQERFHSITRQVFHKAQGLLLMYDITSSQSFRDVRYWVNCIQEGAPDDVIIMLLGNKTDCVELEREVQTHEGENLAKGYDMLFMECSAATGDNVTLSMETLARMLKQLGEETRQEEGSLVLQKESPKKKSGCC